VIAEHGQQLCAGRQHRTERLGDSLIQEREITVVVAEVTEQQQPVVGNVVDVRGDRLSGGAFGVIPGARIAGDGQAGGRCSGDRRSLLPANRGRRVTRPVLPSPPAPTSRQSSACSATPARP
jgi:hypothetical protein